MADIVVDMEHFKIDGLKLIRQGGCFDAVADATGKVAARANAAGHGAYAGDTRRGRMRTPHGLVHTADMHACYGERKHNTLLNSL